MDGTENNMQQEQTPKGVIFSRAARAGKRTYFFDVRPTRNEDYYLTITESKKRFNRRRRKPYYERYRIFLYKEDFNKFMDNLEEAIDFIRSSYDYEIEEYEGGRGREEEEEESVAETKEESVSQEEEDYNEVEFNNYPKNQ